MIARLDALTGRINGATPRRLNPIATSTAFTPAMNSLASIVPQTSLW